MHVNIVLKQKICAAVKAPPDIHMKHARVKLPAKQLEILSAFISLQLIERNEFHYTVRAAGE